MATTVRLLVNYQLSGVNYNAGKLVTVDDTTAVTLVAKGLADSSASAINQAVAEGNNVISMPGLISSGVVKNLYPHNSELLPTANSNTGVAVANVSLPNAPDGIKSGSQTSSGAGAGNCQTNLTVIADTHYWVYSFYAYCPPGVTGAQAKIGSCGFNGGDNAGMTYDFDNPLTVSVNVFGTTPMSAMASCWGVQGLGNGYFRFSRAFKNDGTKTLFIIQYASSVASDKAIISGHMLERIADDGSALPIASPYTPTGTPDPFLNLGRSGYREANYAKYPFGNVVVFSDSIWVAGTNFKLSVGLQAAFPRGYANMVSGTQMVDDNGYGSSVLNRLSASMAALKSSFVVINGGRNDDLSTSAVRDRLRSELAKRISQLGHSNFLVCGVLARYKKSSLDGTEETNAVNVTAYNGIMAFNAALSADYGDRFIDLHRVSVNAYDPLQASDVAAFALDMRPPSLTTSNTDGLHPFDPENKVLMASIVRRVGRLYGK